MRPLLIALSIAAPVSVAAEDSGEVVVIEAEDPRRDEPVVYDLTGEDIRRLPGSGNDPLKALQSLPGVSRVPLGLGGLVLRGSSPRDSAVYIDGIEIPLLYHFGGLASVYPSSMLESVELQPGSFDASYGRAQGGVVTARSKAGRSDRWRFAGEASLLDAQVRADGPGLGGTWSIGLRRSYVDSILALAAPDGDVDLTLAPRYYDGQVRYDTGTPDNRLTVLAIGSDDRLQLGLDDNVGLMPTTDRLRFRQSFVRAGLRWDRAFGSAEMEVVPWIGYDRVKLRFNDEGAVRGGVPMGVRSQLKKSYEWGFVRGGAEVDGGRVDFDVNNEPPPQPKGIVYEEGDLVAVAGDRWYADVAGFIDARFDLDGGRLAIAPGLRLERYGLTGEIALDPRITASHRLVPWLTLKESIGLYSQPPLAVDLEPRQGNPDLGKSTSIQATIGVEARLPERVKVSATGYYDDVRNLAVDVVSSATAAAGGGQPTSGGVASVSRELLSAQFGNYAYQENRGRGRNYGLELFVRRDGQRFAGWVAYTLSRSLRRDDPGRFPAYRRYVLDQPHRLTALGTVALGRGWHAGARVRYASGNPFTPVGGRYFDADQQSFMPIDGETLSERLPAFFQIDLRVDKTWTRGWGDIALFLDIQNLTNRTNAEGVEYNFDYTELDYTRGLPIFPSIGVELRQ